MEAPRDPAETACRTCTKPISHPAHILIMGPGGYRFLDHVKVGGLLTLVIPGVLMPPLPVFRPL